MGKVQSPNPLPVFGQPVFRIVEDNLSNRVAVSSGGFHMNALVYFAVDAVLVKKLEFEGSSLTRVIINQGMVEENNPDKSLEIRYDVEKNGSRGADSQTIFVDEELANQIAAKMNRNQKAQCGKMVDEITEAFNEYDKIIAICEGKK